MAGPPIFSDTHCRERVPIISAPEFLGLAGSGTKSPSRFDVTGLLKKKENLVDRVQPSHILFFARDDNNVSYRHLSFRLQIRASFFIFLLATPDGDHIVFDIVVVVWLLIIIVIL
jgi:hypothetical protein